MKYTTTHLSFVFLLFISSFLLITSPSLAATFRCNPNDYQVLMKIKKSLNNPYHLASWVPNTDCCEWYVVKCDPKNNRINELTVFSGEISGQIPKEVGDLPNLETLVFRQLTNITGSIPQSITKLKNLKILRLSGLKLTGPIPNFLNQLTKLTLLELSSNQLSGSIPPNLSDLKNLGSLYLDRNKLSGSIPKSLGRFTGSIPSLHLSHNQLTGSIPEEMKNLDFLDVSYNRLCGKIPTGGKLQSLGNTSFLHNKCLCGPPLTTICK